MEAIANEAYNKIGAANTVIIINKTESDIARIKEGMSLSLETKKKNGLNALIRVKKKVYKFYTNQKCRENAKKAS